MRIIATLSLIAALSGCATAYQPQSFDGGFSDAQLDTNVFKISFEGNGYTARDKANDFALLRSAEVALQHGFKYFVIIDSQQYSKNSTYTTPTTTTTNVNTSTYGSAHDFSNNATYNSYTYGNTTSTVFGGQTYNISEPRTSNTIVCFIEKPQSFAYNAEFVAKSLKQKYNLQDVSNNGV